MPLISQKHIYRSDLRRNPNVLYLFGDNHQRTGFGGQAREMRGEPNAIGVRTKWAPTMTAESFFSDSCYNAIVEMVYEDLNPVYHHLRRGKIVIIPEDGLGTGLSQLPQRAPRIAKFLEYTLESMKAL